MSFRSDKAYGRRAGSMVDVADNRHGHVRRARYSGGPLAGIEGRFDSHGHRPAPLPDTVPIVACGGLYRLQGDGTYRWEKAT